jgi:hypothetical protein
VVGLCWALLDALGLRTLETFQKSREEVIIRQRREIAELSTPVVKLWEGILALPLIRTLDSQRTQIIMESFMRRSMEMPRSPAGSGESATADHRFRHARQQWRRSLESGGRASTLDTCPFRERLRRLGGARARGGIGSVIAQAVPSSRIGICGQGRDRCQGGLLTTVLLKSFLPVSV